MGSELVNTDCSILPPATVEAWLGKHGLSAARIDDGRVGWPGVEGALTWRDIDYLIAKEDPVSWAALKMSVQKGIPFPDGGWFCQAGDPVRLLPIQAAMARDRGNMIYESGSEVGKTLVLTLKVLWRADTATEGGSIVIVVDSDLTGQPIWNSIIHQFESNPTIAGGISVGPRGPRMRIKPYRWLQLNNGVEIEIRIVGHDGAQLRGAHATLYFAADEMAKAKNPAQWREFWRAAMPGCEINIFSTPDGDYSSPYFAICAAAKSIDGRRTFTKDGADVSVDTEASKRKLRKRNIRKYDLGSPFWTEERAAQLEEEYGGRDSLGWQMNVEGAWGSPAYSVFPATYLNPCAAHEIPEYRVVRAIIHREEGTVDLCAARLSPEAATVDGGDREVLLLKEQPPVSDDLGRRISEWFPSLADWTAPVLIAGGDVGSATDPTEFQFARKIGETVRHIFRLHLRNASWPQQRMILTWLDHASGHRVVYGIDNGSAGSALVQELTKDVIDCPAEKCAEKIHFAERVHPFGFGESNDFIDMRTGQPVMNPDKLDAKGNPTALRLGNKEGSTRYIEKIMQSGFWQVANDGGAGDPELAQTQLLMNHTSHGLNGKGERKFKAQADHNPDSWRQLMLAIVYALRGDQPVWADTSNVAVADVREPEYGAFRNDFPTMPGDSPLGFPDRMSDVLAGF